VGGAAAGSGRGQRISPPLSLVLLSALGCRGCARLAVWAGRLPSRGLHAPLVRLCSWVLLVGRHSAQLGGDACHVGTDKRARPSNCAETLKASGTVLGWRHLTDTTW
jgi:hypothetical protein